MSAHVKFLFDTEFGEAAADAAPPEPVYGEADLVAAREGARSDGYAQGHRAASAEINARLDQKLDGVVRNCEQIVRDLESHREKVAAEAAKLAVMAARTLAPALIAREPHGELMAMFDECISHLRSAPHIVVRVADEDLEPLKEKLEERSRVSGFEGSIVTLREDAMAKGDCALEWADGGISRDIGETARQIETVIHGHYPVVEPVVRTAVDMPDEVADTAAPDTPDAADNTDEAHAAGPAGSEQMPTFPLAPSPTVVNEHATDTGLPDLAPAEAEDFSAEPRETLEEVVVDAPAKGDEQ
jgi:flagellar assembly protein FliH